MNLPAWGHKTLTTWMPESLAARVFLLYGASILLVALTGFGLLAQQEFDRHIEDSRQSVNKIVDLSVQTLTDSAVIGDYDTIHRILATMVPDSPLVDAVYLDQAGGSIRSAQRPVVSAPGWLVAVMHARLPDMQRPIAVGGRQYGELRLRFNTDRIAGDLWALVLKAAALTLLGLALGLGLIRYMLRRWLSNLDRLRLYEAEVLSGAVNARAALPENAPLEIRLAVDLINRTAGSLRAQFGQRIDFLMDALIQHKKAMDEAAIVCELDKEGRLTYANDSFIAAIGLSRDTLLNRRLQDIGSVKLTEQDDWQPDGIIWHGDVCMHDVTGRAHWHRRSIVPNFDTNGQVQKYICIDINISEQKQSEQDLLDQVRRQELITEFGRQALDGHDLKSLMTQVVTAAHSGLRTSHAALLLQSTAQGAPCLKAGAGWHPEWIGRELGPGPDLRLPPELLAAHQISSVLEQAADAISGQLFTLSVASVSPRVFTAADRTFLRSLCNVLATALERNRSREHLIYLAQFDGLTGLPNRGLLIERLDLAMKMAHRQGSRVGLIYLDLDRFKLVNDTLGHEAGDLLLMQAAQRMQACLRSGDTVARLSGDEFAILLPGLERSADVELVARKVLAQLALPFELKGYEAFISASLGAALYPDDGLDAVTLARSADRAMYCSKEAGRNEFHFYREEMNSRAAEQLLLEQQLRGAVVRQEFFVLYQPKVDLRSGQICGFESLLRWQHPTRGVVNPQDFVPMLEESGMIMAVGLWVLRTVAEQIVRWQSEGLTVPRVAINLSARQFSSADMDGQLRTVLAETGVDPRLLEFELTESMLMQNPALARTLLERFRADGLSLSIDDFGTGYSSLAYLRRFPLDALKIDRAFVRDLTSSTDDAAITWAIINLAHSLKLRVVAEGVETEEQLHMLHLHGCDEIQGFYFSVPESAAECAQMLRTRKHLQWQDSPERLPSGRWRLPDPALESVR